MSPVLLIALLALLLGLQPLTTDLYLPALPRITSDLGASVAQTQLTFTAMLLAFGFSQLVWGPASDRFGRRPILLAGIALYTLVGVACALSPTMEWLVVWRTLQGMALGAAVMGARAIVRDVYTPAQGAHAMSKALTGLGVIVCGSPLLGSWLVTHWGWQATMLALATAGAGLWLLVALRFKETLAHPNPQALQLGDLARTWALIARNRQFWAFTATTSFSYAGLVAYLTGSSFTFIQVLGWTPTHVGLMLACSGLSYIAGTIVCRRLLPRWGVRGAVAWSGGVALLSASLVLMSAWLGATHGLAYAAPLMLYMVNHGIQQACGQSGAVSPFPQAAGTAAALNSVCMTLLGFVTGQWLGHSFNGTVFPLVMGLSAWALALAAASWTLVRRYASPAATRSQA